MLDATRLRVLAAVAETGSVGGAAKALNYSQPSISHHLTRLAAETGAQLFRPAGRGIALTEAGRLLARRAGQIIADLDAADAELAALVGRSAGRLRVGAFQSALSTIVPGAVAAMHRAGLDFDLRLTDLHPVEALARVRDGDLDAALVFRFDDAASDDDLHWTWLLDDPVYLLDVQADRTIEDHRDSAWIAGCPRCRADLVEVCATAGFVPNIAYDSEDVVVDQALVTAGLGVTTLPGLALRSYRDPGVHATEIAGRRRHIFAVTRARAPVPALIAEFVTAVRQTAAVS